LKSSCSIHGRFQPFHNGHLQYFRWAKARYELVYVGITQIYGSNAGDFPGAPHRGEAESNPLTFFERSRLIEAALVGEGVDISSFRIIPFPIEDVYRLRLFLPLDVPCCTTIHSEWNEHKIVALREAGYEVEVLASDEANVLRASGSDIRKMMRSGDDMWRRYVPTGAAALIETDLLKFLNGGRSSPTAIEPASPLAGPALSSGES